MRVILLFILISCSILNLLTGCRHEETSEPSQSPASLIKIPGSEFNQVLLSQEAAHRIAIQLVPLKEYTVPPNTGVKNKAVPYSAVIYGLHGETWVYTLVKPLTFVRVAVMIDHIVGDVALLSAGPPVNTPIVSIGATELYGTEYIGNIEP